MILFCLTIIGVLFWVCFMYSVRLYEIGFTYKTMHMVILQAVFIYLTWCFHDKYYFRLWLVDYPKYMQACDRKILELFKNEKKGV